MRAGLISLDISWQDRNINYIALTEAFNEMCSRDKRPDLLVLPEMFSTGFTMSSHAPEDFQGETINFLKDFARQNRVNIIAGFCDKNSSFPASRPLNKSVALDSCGNIMGVYSKRHLFPLAGEPDFFDFGKEYVKADLAGFGILMFICYDLRFPEDFRQAMRSFGSRSVQVISVIANWPASRDNHWRTLIQARAIENQCYILACNRKGKDKEGLLYCGSSMIVGPDGVIIREDQKYLPWISAEISIERVKEVRKKMPFLPF
jgi:predicted amidohydrolase